MNAVSTIFSLGLLSTPQGPRLSVYAKPSFLDKVPQDDKPLLTQAVTDFARDHLGLVVVPRHDIRAQALALSGYKVTESDAIQWDRPLYDSDGFEHSLVVLGSVEVVTKQSFVYCVWDRKTGQCKREGADGIVIGNKPMSEQEHARRRAVGQAIMDDLRAQAAAPSELPRFMYALAESHEDGVLGHFCEGPYPDINPHWVDGDDFVFRLSGEGDPVPVSGEEMISLLAGGEVPSPKASSPAAAAPSRRERFSRSRG